MNDQPTPEDGKVEPATGRAGAPGESTATASQRIQVIMEAAEKAAAGIIDDAEAQARVYVETARQRTDRIAEERAKAMRTVTDSLVEQAESVKRQSDDLISALDEAKAQIDQKVRQGPEPIAAPPPPLAPAAPPPPLAPAEERPAPPLKSVEPPAPEEEPITPPAASIPDAQPSPEAEPATSHRAREGSAVPSVGARLLATQMTVAGSSRAEVESRLRNEFGIEDAGPMLDAILGPED